MTYEMKCDCGEKMTVEALSQEEAIRKMKDMMTEEAIKQHMATKHPGQSVPTVEQAYAMIEENLKQVA